MQMERLKSLLPGHQYKPIGADDLKEIEATPIVRTNKKLLRKIYKCSDLGEFPSSLLRFGPVYYADDKSENAKEEAWRQVLRKSQDKDEKNMDKNKETSDKDEETTEAYLFAIRRVEEKASATYAVQVLDRFTESQFRWMMIKDGCLFLQLALFILGASKELGYPDNHIIFGKKQHKRVVYGWIKSMFYVGNQIPLVILNELMKQVFFQEVIKNHKNWERPTDQLSKGILYDLLIQPAKAYAASQATDSIYLLEEQPSDLLHGLQNSLLGPRVSRNDLNEEEEDEEDEQEDHDLEDGAKMDTVEIIVDNDGKEPSISSLRIKGIYLGTSNGARIIRGIQLDNTEDGEENDNKERCVSGFRKKGIHFCKLNGAGIRGIQFQFWKLNGVGIRGIGFQNRVFYLNVYLPMIPLKRDTEMLFENLKYYEKCHQQKEVTSYLGLLNQIISTYEDINHLASKGIFEVSKPQYKERFLKMLRKLCVKETTTINHDHRFVLQRLRDYSSFPWEYFKYVAILAFILTILQTVFGVLSYVVGEQQLDRS